MRSCFYSSFFVGGAHGDSFAAMIVVGPSLSISSWHTTFSVEHHSSANGSTATALQHTSPTITRKETVARFATSFAYRTERFAARTHVERGQINTPV
jgi:hypothetical protein